jgi:hypothetical protein
MPFLNPYELNLISSYFLIEVEPLCLIKDLNLLSGPIPELHPLSITKIPYFVALPLKNSNLLQIRLPSFLSKDFLCKKIDEEIKNKNEYSFVPEVIFVLGKEIIKNCYNSECNNLNLLDNLKEIRFKKTLLGLENLDGSTLNLNNLTAFEFNEVKVMMCEGMKLIE